METIRPFRIEVPSSEVEYLKQRLRSSRIPHLFDAGWEYGPPVEDIKRISKYWAEEFSWQSFEERLNELPNYEAAIAVDGFDPCQVHFIHQRSDSPDAIPLLFVHGCACA